MDTQASNKIKFERLRELDLPSDQYIIVGSGPLGIRNIKTIGDIDIVVTFSLWDILKKKYGHVVINGVKKIVFPGGDIEAFCEDSFYKEEGITNLSYIQNAERIEDLPFDSIENVLSYKRRYKREKDLIDIGLIEKWLKNRT